MQSIYIILTFFFLSSFSVTCEIYLNKLQQKQIVNLVKQNQLTFSQREKVNHVLFEAYKNFAHKKASDFKYVHRYKCRNINIKDLISASEYGLMKAALHYNGNSSFYFYSSLHIKNELLTALTNHNAFMPISKTTLRKGFSSKNQNFDTKQFYNLQNKLNIIYESTKKPVLLNLNPNDVSYKHPVLDLVIQSEENTKLWDNILLILENPFLQKIFILKYDKDFNKIRTDKEISEIIGYSKGHINLNIGKIKNILRENFPSTCVK